MHKLACKGKKAMANEVSTAAAKLEQDQEVSPPSKRLCLRNEEGSQSNDEPQLGTKEQQLQESENSLQVELEKPNKELKDEPQLDTDEQQLQKSEDSLQLELEKPNNELKDEPPPEAARTEPQLMEKQQLEICKDEKSRGNFAKRKKVVLLLSYCGQGYMGMQK